MRVGKTSHDLIHTIPLTPYICADQSDHDCPQSKRIAYTLGIL